MITSNASFSSCSCDESSPSSIPDKSLTRLNEGSGIGLSIVKSIVELNNGEIYLDSDGENGTEFEILLPNEKLEGDKYEYNYEIDIDKIELEFSDIYELYS